MDRRRLERDGRSPTSHPGVEKERVSSFLGIDGKAMGDVITAGSAANASHEILAIPITAKLLLEFRNFGVSRDELTPLRRLRGERAA